MQEKKFSGVRLLITIVFVLLTALAVGGGTWYFMDQQARVQKEETDKQIAELVKQIAAIEKDETTGGSTDETSDWKIFTGIGFTVKYPSTWVSKDYSKLTEGSSMVGFADKTANLAPEQSDGHSVVDVTWSKSAIVPEDLTTAPEKLTTTTVKLSGGFSAVKYVLAAGRANDMDGTSKEVIYEVKLSNGSYLTIRNVGDVQAETFEKMVQTIK